MYYTNYCAQLPQMTIKYAMTGALIIVGVAYISLG